MLNKNGKTWELPRTANAKNDRRQVFQAKFSFFELSYRVFGFSYQICPILTINILLLQFLEYHYKDSVFLLQIKQENNTNQSISFRSRQDLNLRGNLPTDFKSVALTTRPPIHAGIKEKLFDRFRSIT